MRYLFRGAVRSVARSPVQTLILLVTVALSSMLFTMITEASLFMTEESALAAKAKYGNADIVISAGLDGSSAYIGSADIASALDGGDVYSGYSVIPAYDGAGTSVGAATDFYTIGEIFEFSFIDYGCVTSENINSAIFVTRSFADERALAVGDTCEISVLGKTAEYVVQGINANYFFGSYSFIVNAAGVLDILSAASPVFAVFDGDNVPFNEVYVRINGNIEQKITAINAALNGSGWLAEYADSSAAGYQTVVIKILIPAIALFTAVIAGVLVYFSLDIISRRRARETENYILAGIPPVKVALAFIIETTIYIAVGTLCGVMVSGCVLPVMAVGRFSYVSIRLTYRGALVCVAAELGVEVIASLIYFARHGRAKKSKKGRVYAAITACILIILTCAALAFVIPVTYRHMLSVIGFAAVVALIFACVSPLCRGGAKVFAPRAEKVRGGVTLSLALKNSANIAEFHNVLRILCILLSVCLTVAACLSYMSEMVDVYADFIDCDYVVINADESVAEEIAAVEGTEKCCTCCIFECDLVNGINCYLADIGDSDFTYGNDYAVSGNGIYLPKTFADILGVSVGDSFVYTVSGVQCPFTLIGYVKGKSVVGYFDADYFGFNKNIVLVRADSSEEYLARLSQDIAVYGAFAQTPDSLFEAPIKNLRNLNYVMRVYMTIMCAVAVIGTANLVAVSYAARKKQFSAMRLVGMTCGDVAAMIAFEAAIIALFALVTAAIGGAYMCYLLDGGLRSFGFSFF